MPNLQSDKDPLPSQQISTEPVVLVTMGGRGLRFKQAGYDDPKPFVNVLHKPMLFRLLDLFPQSWSAVFVMNDQDYNQAHVEKISQYRQIAKNEFIFIKPNSNGPLQSVLAGVEAIDDAQPVFVTYCDYGLEWNAEDFLTFIAQTQSDICFVSYKGFHPHYLSSNMYCYTKTDGYRVMDIKEKECFSANREDDYASTGGYYFKSARLLKEALSEQKRQNLSWNGEFFTSLAAKALMNVKPNLNVTVFEIKKFYQWGTPEDLKAFEYWASINYEKFSK